MFNRRSFIRSNAMIAGALLFSDAADALAAVTRQINTAGAALDGVNIFHTNDMNGQVSRGLNGYGGLELFGKNVKDQEFQGLLLDGGGFLKSGQTAQQDKQFVELMNRIGYHAATIGPAELSGGQAHLAQLASVMNFSLVNCNYRFSDGALTEKVKPYIVLKYGKHRIGVTGVGPEVRTAGVEYRDPSASLATITETLKTQENCTVVICLAHLGFQEKDINNLSLAKSSQSVDFIIGGDASAAKTHGTSVVKNKAGYDVFVSHTAIGASVFNHTSFAVNKTIEIRSAIPGIANLNASFKELAQLNLSLKNNLIS